MYIPMLGIGVFLKKRGWDGLVGVGLVGTGEPLRLPWMGAFRGKVPIRKGSPQERE